METHDFRRSIFRLVACSSTSLSESLDEKLLADPPLRILWSVRATLLAWSSLPIESTLPRRVFEFGVSSPRVFIISAAYSRFEGSWLLPFSDDLNDDDACLLNFVFSTEIEIKRQFKMHVENWCTLRYDNYWRCSVYQLYRLILSDRGPPCLQHFAKPLLRVEALHDKQIARF